MIQHMYWIIKTFIKKKDARIIIMGDFNKHLTSLTKNLKNLGLDGVIEEGTATKILGNHLD